MQKYNIKAEKRTIVGKQVKKLRKQGLLPVSVFGKDVKSEALSVPVKEFMTIFNKAGETGLVELGYEGKTQHVLISHVQIHPLSRLPLHAELHAVKLTDKIKANVPVHIEGEAPVVKDGIGVILQTLNEVEVEALPANLPESITVNVEALSEVGQQIKVADLKVSKEVEILTDREETVVNVGAAVSEDTAKEVAAEEAAKAAEATTEGEAAPAAAGTPEAKPEEKKE